MSYRVLIYSRDTIFQIGISLCIKKCFPNVTIHKAKTLEQVFATDIYIDLLVFDNLEHTDLYQIKEQMSNVLKDKKIIFFIENNNVEKFPETKEVIYLNKDSTESEVIKRIRLLLKNKFLKVKRISKNILNNNALSNRELQCAILLMKGNSVSEISKKLSLRMSTVSTYKMRIHKKTNSKNVIQLIKKYKIL